MITSAFSHSSAMHFGFNMLAFYSIGSSLYHSLSERDFLSLYVGSTLISSGMSLLSMARMANPAGSIGASGALYGIFTAYALRNPDSELMIIFLPFMTFSALGLLKCLVGFDAVMLLASFFVRTRLDHAGHLGGALAGFIFHQLASSPPRPPTARRNPHWDTRAAQRQGVPPPGSSAV
mmetsp:Transcript_34391/g.96954  ORF Transcript_34391/g.96954 Transcript_34391/m.96954 type:complete len:178 (-) Transcript_34391:34-567(-)|eukprot:CAMPEP_0119151826 /NCGR_PEP_ID=MMETSP1310-20130426/46860_1 /TAXON_ID=464262 /ORGANISM="Genus nov. species nov., Strain RCC2339" /LENGTH=177 /DNA_ID=CAMNT_0007144133 /DNA_START=249 /DNA_END=782 /DNA_ORIENTATION=-